MIAARLRGIARVPWIGPLAALAVVWIAFAVIVPDTFVRTSTLLTMARQTMVVGVASAGMTLVIVTGGIDLSVGSGVALTTVIVARALRAGLGVVGAVALAAGALATTGAATGLVVGAVGITPFIVTLGTMSVLRGMAKGLAGEQKIDADPRGLDALAASPRGFLPPGVWVLAATAAIAGVVLGRTRFGRHVVAIGSNEQTARLCGVRVTAVKTSVYAIAGVLTAVAGVLEFSRLTVGDPTDSVGLELDTIAAVVIGGGSLSGGSGSTAGSLVGAFLMTVIKTGCTHVGVPNWVQEVVTGAIIVLAAVVDRLRTRRRT